MIFIIRTATIIVVSTGMMMMMMMILNTCVYCVTRIYIIITQYVQVYSMIMLYTQYIPVFHLCSAAEWAEPSDEPPWQPIIQACCTVDYYLETILKKILCTYLSIIHTYVCKYSQSYDIFSFFSSHFISKIFHHNVSAYITFVCTRQPEVVFQVCPVDIIIITVIHRRRRHHLTFIIVQMKLIS